MPETRTLTRVDMLRLPVTQPFNFRYTLWKPSHFATGLEQHSQQRSWRTFRLGELVCGVVLIREGSDTVRADVYSDGPWQQADRDRLTARLIHFYGLDEDLSAFVALVEQVPPMREPLAALAGMRRSCPENLFEIATISLLLQNATVARTTQMISDSLDREVCFDELWSGRARSAEFWVSAADSVQCGQGRRRSRGARLPPDLDLPVRITNCCNNYGPHQFPEKVIPLFPTKALCNEPLPLYASTHNRREWLHVSDHCRTIDEVLRRGRIGETYHVGSGEEVGIATLAGGVGRSL